MAEVLLMAREATVDHPMAYQPGHAVVVMEDGHEWGAEECAPTFLVVKLPGVPPEKLARFFDTDVDHKARTNPAFAIALDVVNPPATMRRAWQIEVWRLPTQAQAAVGTGEVTIAVPGYYDPALHGPADFQWWQVKPVLRNLVEGRYESFDL